MNLDLFITRCNKINLSIDKQCKIKTYLKIEEKFNFLNEYKELVKNHMNDYPGFQSFTAFVIFNLLTVKYYTDIKLEMKFSEFDDLQENGLIDKIVEFIGQDYSLLLRFVQLEGNQIE